MRGARAWLCFAALLVPRAAPAETLYLTDRLEIPLRADFTEGAATAGTVESGASLEVLERYGRQARVRDENGAEGWIEERYLTTRPPARAQVQALETDLHRARARLERLQAQADRAPPAPAPPTAALKALETELAGARAELARTRAALAEEQARPGPEPAPATEAHSSAETAPPGDESGPVVLWVLAAFAMLLVGFVAGIVWVRQSIRRRMGGMYLRV